MPRPVVAEIFTLLIHGLGSAGEGVGYYEGYTVFVEGALPRERVQVRLIEAHKRYGIAKLLAIIEPSSDRVEPLCKVFGLCGGCQLMHLAYPKQLEVKRQRVVDALERIGKCTQPSVAPCVPSPHPFTYRNKIQLPLCRGPKIGLYARGSHDLIDVDHCHIHCSLGEQVYGQLRALIQEGKVLPYDPVTKEGELSHLLIKTAVQRQEVLVVFVTPKAPTAALQALAEELLSRSPSVRGVVHNRQREGSNVVLGAAYTLLAGQRAIEEALSGLVFKISPASFFQVNPGQAEALYAKVFDYAALNGSETVWDAYCGVGTLALLAAQRAGKVIGTECIEEAVEDARQNAIRNGIENVSFFCVDAERFIHSLEKVDVVLVNPPRSGCESGFLLGIKRLLPKKVIYVSCDPATLARDIAYLQEIGYRIHELQPFDMFPQTAHVECVASLSLQA